MSESKQKFKSNWDSMRACAHTHTHTQQKFHVQVLYKLSVSAIYC